MARGFSTGVSVRRPAATPPPPPPSPNDPATNQALDQASAAERKAKGRASTVLTGGTGLEDSPVMIARRTLLGS